MGDFTEKEEKLIALQQSERPKMQKWLELSKDDALEKSDYFILLASAVQQQCSKKALKY